MFELRRLLPDLKRIVFTETDLADLSEVAGTFRCDASGSAEGMYELARRYNSRATWFRLWVRKYEADEMAEAVRVVGCEYKIAELERNVGQLVMEVDLLKNEARLGRAGNDAN